jgi:hypothetical protein
VTYGAYLLDEKVSSSNHAIDDIVPETFVLVVRHFPWNSATSHCDIYHGNCPDVQGCRLEVATKVPFRGSIRVRITTLLRQRCFFAPTKVETFSIFQVRNLETSTGAEKKVLWLQVAMSNAHIVHIIDAVHELFEETVSLGL